MLVTGRSTSEHSRSIVTDVWVDRAEALIRYLEVEVGEDRRATSATPVYDPPRMVAVTAGDGRRSVRSHGTRSRGRRNRDLAIELAGRPPDVTHVLLPMPFMQDRTASRRRVRVSMPLRQGRTVCQLSPVTREAIRSGDQARGRQASSGVLRRRVCLYATPGRDRSRYCETRFQSAFKELPSPLPAGERVIWQGASRHWQACLALDARFTSREARDLFRGARLIRCGGYGRIRAHGNDGGRRSRRCGCWSPPPVQSRFWLCPTRGCSAVAACYTITSNRRVAVPHSGVALPMTMNHSARQDRQRGG